jgi:hypothetical protein
MFPTTRNLQIRVEFSGEILFTPNWCNITLNKVPMCEIFVDLTCLNQTLLYGAILILTDFFVILHCN